MRFPKNIYVVSVDPMHYSHLNTLLTAEKEINEKVSLVICRNELKTGGMFTLEERKEIASSYMDPTDVYLAHDYMEVREFLSSSERVIRGIRSNHDYEYIKKLGSFYKVEDMEHKLYLVRVPSDLKNISSSNIKRLIGEGQIEQAGRFCNSVTVDKVKEKLQATVATVELK